MVVGDAGEEPPPAAGGRVRDGVGAGAGHLHAGNVLRGTRAPWLAIDPKPIAGERAFDLVVLARNRPDRAFVRRMALAAGVDPERALGWALAHALAWGYEPGDRWIPSHVAAAEALSRVRLASASGSRVDPADL